MLIYQKYAIITDAAHQKLSNHRCLNEDTVVSSFFGDHPLLTAKIKESMAK